MPLINAHSGKQITAVPYQPNYRRYLHNLAKNVHPLAIQSAKQAFHAELAAGIVTTSWVPGTDWTGTAYQALYDALNDETEAAKFFGLVACECVIERCRATGETWAYGHYEKDGVPIKGRTYFMCNVPTIAAG